jgi:prolipoprotein diacylglyceryltransferase
LKIPFEPYLLGYPINIHLVLEYLAFIVGFRYYVILRRRTNDTISDLNRLSILIGAVFGAFIGSRLIGILENPFFEVKPQTFLLLLNTKSIMGGLFGGLLGVEIAKKSIGEKSRSGDLFTFPIILGIMIGRIGCFLSGIKDMTYGLETNFFMGMDLGDGKSRHPVALYEIFFLLILFVVLYRKWKRNELENGRIFQYFMISYFSFRFLIEFIKPHYFTLIGLTTIQFLCLICLIYYSKTILIFVKSAGKRLHIL